MTAPALAPARHGDGDIISDSESGSDTDGGRAVQDDTLAARFRSRSSLDR
jgi:hypothetical protein